MAKNPRNENGLTQQEERFCKFYVNQYANLDEDGSDNDIALVAYRMAYNCKSDALEKTHREKACRLKNTDKIRARIKELRQSVAKDECFELADAVNRTKRAMDIDPLDLMIFDKRINKWRLRFMHEIRKEIRDIIPYKIDTRTGRIIPAIDRDALMERLIRILGLEAPKELNVKNTGNLMGEFRIGFGDEDDDKM